MTLTAKIHKVFDEDAKTSGSSWVKAIASVTIGDDFAVHGVKVLAGSNGDIVVMPATKYKDRYQDTFHPITVTLDGGIRFSESTDHITLNQLEGKLKKVTFKNSKQPLFESITMTENKGIFYNSYRISAVTHPQKNSEESTLTITMPGKPSGVRNGIIQEKQVVFPLIELADPIELVAEFEENNIGIMIGIIAVLVVIMAAFFIFIKRGGGGGYDSY